MTKPSSKRQALESSFKLDRLCDEFERELLRGENPKIEEYLGRIEPTSQAEFFEQVLALELELSTCCPLIRDYAERFPQFEAQVESVFGELNLLDWIDPTIGKYEVIEELGRGGMGVVFLAKDPSLEREVAIKLLTRERRSDFRWLRRFRSEARLASGLNHPNVLTIHEIGEDQDTPFIASEFVDGVTLQNRIAARPLKHMETLKIASQIASGMVAAHQAGIIHRDLKADNVMIRKDGLIKILDFGLAKQTELAQQHRAVNSRAGAITGTVQFMSPEQARGQTLTSATDVFSFGILLHLMIARKLPFEGPTMSDIIAQILNEHPPPIRGIVEDTPIEIEELITGCLEKQPQRRPTFEQVHDVLKTLLHSSNEEEIEFRSSAETSNFAARNSLTRPDATHSIPLDETMEPSEIRYALSGDVNIAWQEVGEGPFDIVFVMGWVSHLEWFWKDPSFSRFLRRMATFARVILFDKRGTGLSDRVPVRELPDLETRMDDVRAVMKAAGSEHAVLCGVSEGGPLSALFAATYPHKTIALTMIGSYSRRLWAEDYPWGPTTEQREHFLDLIGKSWGGPVGIEDRAPSLAEDPQFRDWWAKYLRMGASPGAAIALTKMNAQIDIRPILPSIHVPTLVIHRSGDRCLRVEEGRYLAERIPGAKFVEFPGDDHLPFVGDAEIILDEIESFLTGLSGGSDIDCVLATVLCVQASTSDLDQAEELFKAAEREVAIHRGKNSSTESHSMLVTFDGPVRSVLCALAICRLAQRLEIEVCCGLETGTCNIDKSEIHGPAVDGAREVAELAPCNSVWLKSSLMNLISGSEILFSEVDERTGIFEASQPLSNQ